MHEMSRIKYYELHAFYHHRGSPQKGFLKDQNGTVETPPPKQGTQAQQGNSAADTYYTLLPSLTPTRFSTQH